LLTKRCSQISPALLRRGGNWYRGYVKELPSVNTQGKTLKKVRENLKEALYLIIEASRELATKSQTYIVIVTPAKLVLAKAGSRGLITEVSSYYVYILTNARNTTLYTGITNNLVRRVYEHKNNQIEGFTRRYRTNKLVYFEETTDALSAITREKQIKKWRRRWKIELIEKNNPQWRDLYYDLV
jgi:putative endonuclease